MQYLHPSKSPLGSSRAAARALLRHAVYPLITLIWSALFALMGRWSRPHVTPIHFASSDRVLVLAPHPDDETIGCGGTIALHARAGANVTVCVITDGSRSRANGIAPDQMARRRRREAQLAVSGLGNTTLIQLDLPEGSWREAALSDELATLLKQMRPTIIYTTSPIDYHPDHMGVALCLAHCLQSSASATGMMVRLYEVQVPLTPLLANRMVNITATATQKKSALDSYRTQLPALTSLPRLARYNRVLYRADGPIELFTELTAQQFGALCRAAVTHPARYFGMRPRPFTDPLSWLVGCRTRLHLRKVLLRHGN